MKVAYEDIQLRPKADLPQGLMELEVNEECGGTHMRYSSSQQQRGSREITAVTCFLSSRSGQGTAEKSEKKT